MKTNLPVEQRVGITECGDPGLDFSWIDKLNEVAFAILITKHLNDELIDELIKYKNKIILHITCTGMGRTLVEPGVPLPRITFSQLTNLIDLGFPGDQIVFRLDPVVPTDRGINTATSMLDKLINFNLDQRIEGSGEIERVRYSFLDMYKHVEKRFIAIKAPLPYGAGVFTAPKEMQNNFMNAILPYREYLLFESCAEYTRDRVGCVSNKDIKLMNSRYGYNVVLQGSVGQRVGCLCPQNKVQIIDYKKDFNCPSKCIYCYWKG